MTDAVTARLQKKYAKHTGPEHKMAMASISVANMLLAQHREQFDKLVEAERYMHNVGGLLDPTLYKDMMASKSVEVQLRLVKAALAFLDAVDAERGEDDKLPVLEFGEDAEA